MDWFHLPSASPSGEKISIQAISVLLDMMFIFNIMILHEMFAQRDFYV